jgi:hypothetical protein
MGISSYSTTPANNTALFPEGMARATVNDSSRQVQADIRSWYETAEWVDYGYTPTYATTTSFTMSGDRTSFFTVGRRIRMTDATTLYGTIASSSFGGGNTTVTVTMDSGTLSVSLTAVAPSIIKAPSGTGSSIAKDAPITADSTTTLTNKTLTAPKFADLGFIADTSGARLLEFDSDTTAVNYIGLQNKATSGIPTIYATGSDSTVSMGFQMKGSGAYNFYGTTAISAEVRIFEDADNGTNYIGFKAPTSIATSKTWIFPESDTTNGYLKSDGSGNLSLATVSAMTPSNMLIVRHTTTDATDAGTFTSGSWATRTLNTTTLNNISGASVASNQITLPAGTYFAEFFITASRVAAFQARLQDVTNTVTLDYSSRGQLEVAGSSDNGEVQGTAYFTLAGSTLIELQGQCQTTRATDGQGFCNTQSFSSTNVWAEVKIFKI